MIFHSYWPMNNYFNLRHNQPRRRSIRLSGRPFLVGLLAHAKIQFTAGENIAMGKPRPRQLLAIEFGTLNVTIIRGIIFRNYGKSGTCGRIVYLHTVDQRTADHIHTRGGIDWIKA